MKILQLLILLIIGTGIQAQLPDSIQIGSLDSSRTINNYNTDILCSNNHYYISRVYMDNDGNINNSIVKTDQQFNEIARVDTIELFGHIQSYGEFIYHNEDDDYALLAGMQYDKNLYNVYKLDLRTLKIEGKISIEMSANRWVWMPEIKIINDSIINGFGYTYDPRENSPNMIYENMFLEIDISGELLTYEELDIINPIEIRSFKYLKNREIYIVSSVKEDYLVLDKELNLLQRLDLKEFTYWQKPGFHFVLQIEGIYFDTKEDYIHCIGLIKPYGETYTISHIRFPLYDDSVGMVDQINPLFKEKEYKFSDTGNDTPISFYKPENLFYSETSEGDLLMVLDDRLNYQNDTFFIFKTNYTDYRYTEKEWYLSYGDGSGYSIEGVDVDKNDDFVIVGVKWRNYQNHDFLNDFYMKINTSGDIVSTAGPIPDNLMIVYPNPTEGPFHIKGDAERTCASYKVYDINGQLLKEGKTERQSRFDITELQPGTYFILFQDGKDKPVGNSKVVKY